MRRRQAASGPLVLAADTSTLTQSVALVRGEQTLAEMTLTLPRGYSRALLKMVDDLLAHAATPLSQVDLLAIGLGPGSFTGLRVGLALFKGLALSFDKPLYGASSLEASARRYALGGHARMLICPCIDARKGELYACLYEPVAQPGQPLRALTAELVAAPDALADEIARAAPDDTRPILFVGTGAREHAAALQARFGERARLAPRESAHACAADLARQALALHARGEAEPLATLEPRYIRPSDADLGPPGSA